MALGRRVEEWQGELWVATDRIAGGSGHVFYDRLNDVLNGAGFDLFVEELCEPFYATSGRPSIPPGVYFRMLLVGYFEGIGSQRGIAWRCADSLSLRRFLGLSLTDKSPDHSSLTRISDRLPLSVYEQVFAFVLDLVDAQGLLKAKTVAVDSTLLEANAAMKAIVRKETGEDWNEYLTQLMRDEGVIEEDEEPTDEERRRFDKQRAKSGKKKVSNKDWESPVDADARIVRMKDGRTRMGYRAEHVVDLESDVILSAQVQHGTESDSNTLARAVIDAQANLIKANCDAEIEEVVADKGYHANDTITECEGLGLRTYIPEPNSPHDRRWTDKPEEVQRAVLNNRRRTRRGKGRRLQRQRSEKVERSFAHICNSGGTRRSWLRGLTKINKRYSLAAAAHNLSQVIRKLFGMGQPRSLQGMIAAFCALLVALKERWARLVASITTSHPITTTTHRIHRHLTPYSPRPQMVGFSTDC